MKKPVGSEGVAMITSVLPVTAPLTGGAAGVGVDATPGATVGAGGVPAGWTGGGVGVVVAHAASSDNSSVTASASSITFRVLLVFLISFFLS